MSSESKRLSRLRVLLGWVADDSKGWLVSDDVNAGDPINATCGSKQEEKPGVVKTAAAAMAIAANICEHGTLS